MPASRTHEITIQSNRSRSRGRDTHWPLYVATHRSHLASSAVPPAPMCPRPACPGVLSCARHAQAVRDAGRVRQPTVKLGRSKSSVDLPIRADAQPAPGAHQDLSHLHPNKDSGPKFSFGCRDGISPETFAKSRLGVVAHRKAETKRCELLQCMRSKPRDVFLSLAERLSCLACQVLIQSVSDSEILKRLCDVFAASSRACNRVRPPATTALALACATSRNRSATARARRC